MTATDPTLTDGQPQMRNGLSMSRRRKHVHEWVYGKPTVGGWGVARCRICGETELYA